MRLLRATNTDHPRVKTIARFDTEAHAITLGLIPPAEQIPSTGDHYTWGSWDPLLIDVDGNNEIAAIEILQFPHTPLSTPIDNYLKDKQIIPAHLIFEDTDDFAHADIYEGNEKGFRLRISTALPERFYATNENVVFGITSDNRIAELIYLG